MGKHNDIYEKIRWRWRSIIRGRNWWIIVSTFLLVIILLILFTFAVAHTLYRAQEGNTQPYKKICETLSAKFPLLARCFWFVYSSLRVNLSMDTLNQNGRDTISTAVCTVLNTMGITSVALAYISSARSHITVGFRAQTIIERRYPASILFFVGQGIFVFFGLYTAARDILFASSQCLLGAAICLAYSINMAIHVAFSEKFLRQSAKAYMLCCTNQEQCWLRHDLASKKEGRIESYRRYNDRVLATAGHAASYLNGLYTKGELTLVEDLEGSIDFNFLVSLLDKFQTVLEQNSTVEKSKENNRISTEAGNHISEFVRFFSDQYKTVGGPVAMVYALPITKEIGQLSMYAIEDSLHLWEILLNNIQEPVQRAGLARHLLCVAAGHGRTFPLLLCGLAAYMRINIDPTIQRDNTRETYTFFLRMLTYGNAIPPIAANEAKANFEEEVFSACGDLAALLGSLYYVELAFSKAVEKYCNDTELCIAIREIYNKFGHGVNRSLDVYLATAYMICDCLHLFMSTKPTQLEMRSAIETIRQNVENML